MGVITLRLGDPRGKPSHLIWWLPVSRCLASWNSCAIPNNDDQEQGQIPKFNNMSGWHPIFYTFPLEFHSKKLGEIPPGRWSNSNPGIWSPAWGAAALNPDQLMGDGWTTRTLHHPKNSLLPSYPVSQKSFLYVLLKSKCLSVTFVTCFVYVCFIWAELTTWPLFSVEVCLLKRFH